MKTLPMNGGQATSYDSVSPSVRFLIAWAFAIIVLALIIPVRADEAAQENAAIVRVDDWSCIFADQETTFRYLLPGKAKHLNDVEWRLTDGDRVIVRGLSKVSAGDDESMSDRFTFRLKTPTLKPGLTLSARINVKCEVDGAPRIEYSHPVEIFSPDAFSDRLATLREQKIQLYDPLGTTASGARRVQSSVHPAPHAGIHG